MHTTGFRTHQQIRQARREFQRKHPHIRTNEDRAAASRMDALAYVLFLCIVVIPGAVLIADMLTGLEFASSAILMALEAVK